MHGPPLDFTYILKYCDSDVVIENCSENCLQIREFNKTVVNVLKYILQCIIITTLP